MPEDYLPGLRPLLKEAVERSPNTIIASISVAAAQAARIENTAALYPGVNLASSYQETKENITNSVTSTARGLYYSGGITQPLFQWEALKNSAEIGKLSERAAERNFEETYRILAQTIREQYIGLIGRKILLRNAQFNQKLSKESLDAQNARFEAGASSQAELGTFRIAYEQAQLDADRAKDEYQYQIQLFTRLVGVDDMDENSIPLVLPHPEFSAPLADTIVVGFVGGGVESTFQSEIYKLYTKEGDLNYSIAKVRLLPKFSASASYSYSNQTSTNGLSITQVGVQSESYAVSANWSIFDGFATRGAKLAALASKRQYEQQEKAYVDTSIDQISDMRHQLGFSVRAMSIAEVHYSLFEAEVKRLNQDQALGYASQASIDSGLLTLYATDYQRHFARSDYYNRWTEFVSLAGIDPALANVSSRYGH